MCPKVLCLIAFAVFALADDSFRTLDAPALAHERTTATRAATIYEVPFSGFPAYGVPSGSDGFPSYYERAILQWYNIARTGYKAYVSDYITASMMHDSADTSYNNIFATKFTQQPPIIWNLNLNRAARAHGEDLTVCGGAHKDCNGTDTFVRIGKFYSGAGGEIYFGWNSGFSGMGGMMQWPFYAMGGWMCDGPVWSNGKFAACPVDASAGHRSIIMTVNGEVGCGFYVRLDKNTSSTCDSSSKSSPYPRSQIRIASGAHLLVPASTTKYVFAASYGDSAAPSSSYVVVDDVQIPMTLKYGAAANGTYYSATQTYASTDACKKYHFVFGTARYPAEGEFNTYGLGTCQVDWTATPVVSSSTPVVSSVKSVVVSSTTPAPSSSSAPVPSSSVPTPDPSSSSPVSSAPTSTPASSSAAAPSSTPAPSSQAVSGSTPASKSASATSGSQTTKSSAKSTGSKSSPAASSSHQSPSSTPVGKSSSVVTPMSKSAGNSLLTSSVAMLPALLVALVM